jgi:hypothetical protein
MAFRTIHAIAIGAAILAGMFGASPARAVPLGNISASDNPIGPQTVSNIDADLAVFDATDNIEWIIEATVTHDPTMGPWIKVLNLREPTDPVEGDSALLVPGRTFTLIETITIAAGTTAWTDWHEIIQTDEFVWLEQTDPSEDQFPFFCRVTGEVGGCDPIPGLDFDVSDDGTTTTFTFPALQADTEIQVVKRIEFTGEITPDPPTEIVVAEYPTVTVAEPASLALMGAGLFALGFVRRRRAR